MVVGALLLGAATASPAVAPTVAAATPTFTDITFVSFREDIEWLASEGITVGCRPMLFCPGRSVTRGEMASFIARMFKLPATSTDFFTDDETSSHEDNINRLAAAGITDGCTATAFCPLATVSRGEMASFITRAASLTIGGGRDYFYDDDGSTHEADIDRAAAAGIVTGCWVYRYCRVAPVRRQEMAAYLHRVVNPVAALTRYPWSSTDVPCGDLTWEFAPPSSLTVKTGPCFRAEYSYTAELRIFNQADREVGRWSTAGAIGYELGGTVTAGPGRYTIQVVESYQTSGGDSIINMAPPTYVDIVGAATGS